MNGTTTKALLDCIENEDINTEKFFQRHPLNEPLKQDLIKLKNLGYITLDFGDNTITDIAANPKLLDLLKATR